ncbi:MAG: hypothetical protein ACT4OY_00395 [Alphaproteobacteria bacterium]
MNHDEKDKIRLSDRILSALELALEQKDLKICETLTRAQELTMTRNTAAGEFVERPDYTPDIERVLAKYYDLQDQQDGV